jgi:phosphoribosyl-AMP cyclohydrolase / phosphoribosyl-ATP pyrophosphohydrolase
MIIEGPQRLDALDFTKGDGLLPVVVQHAHTGEVLMLAWASREALERCLATGTMWFWSRSRAELWQKGATSGNTQRLATLHYDCDADTLLARVLPAGPACHTGERTCFDAAPTLAALDDVITARATGPDTGSYTRRLLDDPNLRLKKLGEEAVELALACERGEPQRAASEAADLLYHMLVAVRAAGATTADVLAALDERRGTPGKAGPPGAAGGRVSGAAGVPAAGGTASAG